MKKWVRIFFLARNQNLYEKNNTVGPSTTLSLGHQRCSIVQIIAVQGSVFQHCASYFISINPRFQHCASYFISVNPRFQHCASFLSALIQGSALCKNFQDFLVISTIPRSALFKAALCKAPVYRLNLHLKYI